MDTIFVFLPLDLEMAAIAKSAALIHMHRMQNNIQNATIIICPTPTKEQTMTIQELAEILVNQTVEQIDELDVKKFVIPPRVEIADELPNDTQKNKQRNFVLRQSIKQFNLVKQRNKRILFNRTKHK